MRIFYKASIGENSVFSPSHNPDKSLLVFIHGFKGKALRTWNSFPYMLDTSSKYRSYDVLFYGYCSRPGRIQNIALSLDDDMKRLYKDPGEIIPSMKNEFDKREGGIWDKVKIAAHSMGAVVARRAVFDVYLQGGPSPDDWANKLSLTYFAPAHTGASAINLVGEAFHNIPIPVAAFLKGFYPCLRDLEDSSLTLAELRDDQAKFPDNVKKKVAATKVILAEKDGVVNQNRFPGDPPARQIRGVGHSAVCKPSMDFKDPLQNL